MRKIQGLKTEQVQTDLIEKILLAILPEIKKLIIEPNQHYELIDFDKIKWDELLSGAKKIDIFVHYFDTWMRNNSELLKRVFLNNGVIRIILPNIKNRGIINIIKHRFPEYTEKQIREKIIGTKGFLNDYKGSIDKGILEIDETDELGYYCGIKIDEKYFIYSSYEHIRIDRKILGPTFVIRIDKEIEIGQWFSKEFTELSRKVINNKK